jgi:L,D-transpeptidase ErfK/SrfK
MTRLVASVVCAVLAAAHPRSDCERITPPAGPHVVAAGESLASIAARKGIDVDVLAADNGVPARGRVQPGTILQINNRHVVPQDFPDGVVINVPQRMVFLFSRGQLAAAYPVAAGQAGWPTPLGRFDVADKETNPTWDVPVSIQREMALKGQRVLTKVPPGPANPLGDRFIRVRDTGIGLHGTNAPGSIYRLATHGCIRLHPDDIRDLFDRVDVGTPVHLVYEPVLVVEDAEGRVWVEAHPDAYRRVPNLLERAMTLLENRWPLAHVDVDALASCVKLRAGRACEISAR